MTKENPETHGGKACLLMSGGVESAVLLADALSRYDQVTPLYIRNHLRWEETELFWLKKYLRGVRSSKLEALEILDIPMRDIYQNHWSVTGTKVPGAESPDESVYLPGRNIIFLSKAVVFAALRSIPSVEIGVLKTNPFADGSPAFLKKLSDVFSMGVGREVAVKAPFIKQRKEDVILMGKKLPLETTFSCINPKGYEHCGDCNKCMERKKAFFAVGIFDKTKYKKVGM